MNSFEFFEPTTLAEASQLFAQEHALLLAGGTDIVIGMKALTETPQSVISLQKIPDWRVLPQKLMAVLASVQ